MSDKKLTQEEIDKMIKDSQSNNIEDLTSEISSVDLKCVRNFIDKSIEASTCALRLALSKELSLKSSSDIQHFTSDDLTELLGEPHLAIRVDYKGEVDGFDLLLIKKSNAMELAKLQLATMGIELDKESILEMEKSAVLELMNQMMGKSASILSEEYDLNVEISTPAIKELDTIDEANSFILYENKKYISASYKYTLNDSDLVVDILKILDLTFAKNLNTLLQEKNSATISNSMISKMEDDDDLEYDTDDASSDIHSNSSNNIDIDLTDNLSLDYNISQEHHSNENLYGGEHKVDNNIPEVFPYSLSQVDFNNALNSFDLPIDKLNDVTIELSVELGRTKKTIKEILEMGKGSIVELNRLSGEPVDLYANGTLLGHGEVVVIKDYFAIKILEVFDRKRN